MNKNERKKVKSQNSVRLFKIEAHLKYLQDVARSYLCPHASLYLMVRYLPEGHWLRKFFWVNAPLEDEINSLIINGE